MPKRTTRLPPDSEDVFDGVTLFHNEGTKEGKPANWRKAVHADINGSYNILRKMFGWLSFNDKLALEYDLCWPSPKLGITPMKF